MTAEDAQYQTSLTTLAVPPGISVPFFGGATGGESREFVAVDRVVDPLHGVGDGRIRVAPGGRYVVVLLSIRATGGPPYVDTPAREVSLISDRSGGRVGRAVALPLRLRSCRTELDHPIELRAGSAVRGCVVFVVPARERVGAVQYETQRGAGDNAATWALAYSSRHG
jgi:hypothetical protein